MGTLLALNGILRLLGADERVRTVLCLLYVLSPGVWNGLSFLRMYIMLGFWITALTWLYLANERGPVRLYGLWLFLTVYCGILTHHHFLVYLAGASLTYLVILLLRRDGRTILRHVWVVLAGSLCALASFPPMVDQILHSDRGSEAQQGIANWQGYLPRIEWFFNHSGYDLFGSLLKPAALLLLVCLLVVVAGRLQKKAPVEEGAFSPSDLCMLIVPAGLYFLIASITTNFLSPRYLYAVYPLLLVVFGLLLYEAASTLPPTRRIALPLLVVVATLVTTSAFLSASFPYLYRGDAARREALLPYAETDCLYLVQFPREDDMHVDLFTDYRELSLYGSLTAVSAFDPGTPASAFSDRDQLIIVTDDGYFYQSDDLQGEVEAFCERNGLPSHVTDLGEYSTETHTYLCTREGVDAP